MNEVEEILLNWMHSIPKGNEISNSYSIISDRVFLTVARQPQKNNAGKTLKIECANDINSVKHAIEELSEKRESLLL